MFQRIFARSALAAAALLGFLLVPGPAGAQQGWNLYEWSGGWGRSSGGSSYQGDYGGVEYSAPSYFYATPSYYTVPGSAPNGPVTGYQPVYTPQIGEEYGYFAPRGAGEAAAVNRAVLINVSVPANAGLPDVSGRPPLGLSALQWNRAEARSYVAAEPCHSSLQPRTPIARLSWQLHARNGSAGW